MGADKNGLRPGFVMRAATMDDLESVVAMFNQYSRYYMGIDEIISADIIGNEWTSPRFNTQTDIRLVFAPQGRLVGYIEVWTTGQLPVHPWVWMRVHPDYEGFGVGESLLRWAEERAREAIALVPKNARVAMNSGSWSTIQPTKNLLENAGMKLFRHSYRMLIEMDAPPPAPEWPDGINVRVYNPEKDAQEVYLADVEAFRDHFGFVEEPFDEGFERFIHFMTGDDAYDPSLWFLAMSGDEIAGVSLCAKTAHDDPHSGYVSSLSVRRPWRRRGIALGLLHHTFGEFFRRGKRKVALGVDAENLTGAMRLYQKAGMHIHQQFDLYEKELRAGEEISTVQLEE